MSEISFLRLRSLNHEIDLSISSIFSEDVQTRDEWVLLWYRLCGSLHGLDTVNPTWGDIFERLKFKTWRSLLPRFSEKRHSSFEFEIETVFENVTQVGFLHILGLRVELNWYKRQQQRFVSRVSLIKIHEIHELFSCPKLINFLSFSFSSSKEDRISWLGIENQQRVRKHKDRGTSERILGCLTVRASWNSIFMDQSRIVLSSTLVLSFYIALVFILVSAALLQGAYSKIEKHMRGQRMRQKITNREGWVSSVKTSGMGHGVNYAG